MDEAGRHGTTDPVAGDYVIGNVGDVEWSPGLERSADKAMVPPDVQRKKADGSADPYERKDCSQRDDDFRRGTPCHDSVVHAAN